MMSRAIKVAMQDTLLKDNALIIVSAILLAISELIHLILELRDHLHSNPMPYAACIVMTLLGNLILVKAWIHQVYHHRNVDLEK